LPRPPVKKTFKLAEAEALGRASGEMRAHKKKPLAESLREHLGKMIDRVDPLEVVAVVGTTYVLHETILASTDVLNKITAKIAINPEWVIGVLNPLAGVMLSLMPKPEFPKELENIKTPDSIFLWVVCFILAFIVVRHGAELLGKLSGSGGVMSLLPLIGI